MAQLIYGRKLTSATSDGENLATGTAYGQSFGVLSGMSGRIIKLGGWLGAASPPMNGRWSAYTHHASSNAPDVLMGYSVLGVIGNNWTGGSGGQNFEQNVSFVASGRGASQLGIVVRDGENVQLVFMGDETSRHGRVTVAGKIRSNRVIAGTTPPDPFAFTSQTALGKEYAWYAVIEQNRAPVLSNITPDETTLNTLTPTLAFRFTDQDRTDGYNDYPTKAIVRVYEDQAGAYVFVGAHTQNLANPGAGTSFVDVSFAYGGPALSMSKSYVWTLEVTDEVGGTSGTTRAGVVVGTTTPDGSLSFTLDNKGAITTTGPSGKQTTLTPGPFVGNYTHPSASALDKVQLRILKRDNLGQYVVVQTSALLDIANVASGAAVSVSWATSGFTTLEWNSDYAVEWKLTSADASVSDWVGRGFFTTNKIPQQALMTNPVNGDVFTSRPEARFVTYDDDDAAGSGLSGQVEVSGAYVLSNPSFDVDLAGWSYAESSAGFTESFTRVTATPHSGAGNAQVSISATPGNTTDTFDLRATLSPDDLPVVAGETYQINAWVRPNSGDVRMALGVRWETAAGAFISDAVGVFETKTINAWTFVTASFVAPATAGIANVRLVGQNAVSGPSLPYTVQWDDVTVNSGVRFIRSATHQGSNVFGYVLSATDVPVVGVYTLRGRGVDGNNNGPWSAPVVFSYVSAIAGTLTAPSGSLSTSSPQFTWTVDSGGPQTRFRIDVIDADTGTVVYDSQWIVSTDTSFVVPPGYVGNTGSLIGRLWLDNGSAQVLADTNTFSTSYSAPAAPTNFQATPYQHPSDPEETSVLLTWDAISTDPANVERLELWANDGVANTRIAYFPGALGAGVSSFVYPFPRSGVDIEYTIRQIVQQNTGAIQNGLFAQAFARIDLTHLSLVSATYPMSRRATILYWPEPTETLTQVQQWSTPAGALDYVEVPGALRGRDLGLTAQYIDRQDDSGITAQQDKDDLDALFDGVLVDDRRVSDVLCYRDPRGYKHFARFNGNPSHRHGKGAIRYVTTFTLRRVAYTEGAV